MSSSDSSFPKWLSKKKTKSYLSLIIEPVLNSLDYKGQLTFFKYMYILESFTKNVPEAFFVFLHLTASCQVVVTCTRISQSNI